MPSIRGSAAHTSSAGSSGSKVPETTTAVGETMRRALGAGRQVEHVTHRHAPRRRRSGRSGPPGTTCTTLSWSAESRSVRVVVGAPGGPPVTQRTRSSAAPSTRTASSAELTSSGSPVDAGHGERVALRGDERPHRAGACTCGPIAARARRCRPA